MMSLSCPPPPPSYFLSCIIWACRWTPHSHTHLYLNWDDEDTSPSGDGTGVGTSGSTEQRTWKNTVYPFPRQLDELQEQTGVPPLTHLVYAVTW